MTLSGHHPPDSDCTLQVVVPEDKVIGPGASIAGALGQTNIERNSS
jgi:hypothetical protein